MFAGPKRLVSRTSRYTMPLCSLLHLRIQLDRRSIHHECAAALMMYGLGPLLRRIDPCLEHLQDEKVIFGGEPRVIHPAFQVGEALGDERRGHTRGRHGSQAEGREL